MASIDQIITSDKALQADDFFSETKDNRALSVEAPDLSEKSDSQEVFVSMGFDR